VWRRGVERICSSYSFTTSALDGVSGQRHATAALHPRLKVPQYPLYRRLGGPQSQPGHRFRGKISCLCRGSNLAHPVFQSVARHYTDLATWLPGYFISTGNFQWSAYLLYSTFLLTYSYHSLRCHITYSAETASLLIPLSPSASSRFLASVLSRAVARRFNPKSDLLPPLFRIYSAVDSIHLHVAEYLLRIWELLTC
jgi:hypothetical protein